MTPEPGKRSIVSEIIFIGALVVLLAIIVVCGLVIYDYLIPPGVSTPTATAMPTATVSPTIAPTVKPSAQPTASAAPTQDPNAGYYQQDSKVTGGDFTFSDLGIWDHYIVYDMDDGAKNYSKLYDANTRETTQIADGMVFSHGAISNSRVLLFYPKGNKIYLYDIKTRESLLTCTDDNNLRGSATMFDTKLAYYQDIGHYNTEGKWVPNYSIFVFSMIDGYAASVIDNLPKPLDIRIYGDRLVYTVVNGHGGSDVYLLDLATKTPAPRKISPAMGNNNYARIYDHTIVFISDYEGKNKAYIYDINTGKTMSPAQDGEQWHVGIYGNTVVYDDNRNGNWDIYAYDLSSNQERRITNEPHDQMSPVIYGNRIAYMDNRNGYPAIYTMAIG
jgi:beta propeller repeat protein